MRKKLLFILGLLFMSISNVSAKELNIYFYPNGGSTSTTGFATSDYGYLNYNDNYFAKYTEKNTINHINSISGKTFTLSKSSTSLVKGKEWYLENVIDGKIYYFSESATYNVSIILKTLGASGNLTSIDLYANWNSNKKTGGINMPTAVKKATSIKITSSKASIMVGGEATLSTTFEPSGSIKEEMKWTSSNKSIATVDTKGVVSAVKEGKVTITGKSKSGLTAKITLTITEPHYTRINYNTNGGTLSPRHSSIISVKDNKIYRNNSVMTNKFLYNETIPTPGLANCNNPEYINIIKNGYYIPLNQEWNTSPDGSGSTFSQSKYYNSSSFCNASKADCTRTLYVNWKRIKFVRKATVPYSLNTKYGYGSSQSLVYTGKYLIVILTKTSETGSSLDDTNGLYVMKKNDKGVWTYYKFIKDLPFGHGQDVTYIKKDNLIAFLHGRKIHFIDADTFKERKDLEVTMPNSYSCFAYDQKNDNYYLGAGNIEDKKFYYTVCNSSLKSKNCTKKAFSSERDMVGQSCEVNNGYFYKLNYDTGQPNKYLEESRLGVRGGAIDIYDLNYKHQNIIRYTSKTGTEDLGEIEGIDFIGNTPYVLFNGKRTIDGVDTMGRVYTVSY